MIRRRLVLCFPGFEPLTAAAHCRRFVREARRTAPVFDMVLATTEPVVQAQADGVATGSFRVEASGKDWSTRSEIVIFGLGDIYTVYSGRNAAVRVATGMLALADFIVSGTAWRYAMTSWRYLLFLLYPVTVFLALSALGVIVGMVTTSALENAWAGGLAGLLACLGLLGILLLAESRMHLLLIMDDWTFARDLVRERRPEVRTLLGNVAANASRLMREAQVDETIVAAHSIGAVVAVNMLFAAQRHDAPHALTGLLTVGSSLLKVGFHPAARTLRVSVRDLVRVRMPWLDVQTHTDVLSFYKSQPAELLADGEAGGCRTMRIRFRHQLSASGYKAIRHNLFRVHRQYVYGVERRTGYAYHAILCGPEPFTDVVRRRGQCADWSTLVGAHDGRCAP